MKASNTAMKEQNFFTTGQIAAHCGVNFRTVIRWIQRGYLKAYRLPGRGDHRVDREEFLNFLKNNNLKLPESQNPQPSMMPAALETKAADYVLIVDDDENMARSIERTLRRKGLKTEVALNGFKAGFLINQNRPKVVTLDLKMKDIDGFEVLKLIRSSPLLNETKVLVISGDTEASLQKAKEQGADATLSKPFSNEELEAQIDHLIGSKI